MFPHSLSTGSHVADFAIRVAAALFLGGLIGLERQWRQRMGGTRTNALVAAAAAAFVMAGKDITADAQARIAAQVVSGVGFLGAGVIFKEGINVRGLNSAATIWCSSAIGTLCGMGQYYLAGITAALVLLTNVALRPLMFKLHPHRAPLDEQSSIYTLTLVCAASREAELRKQIESCFKATSLVLSGLQSTMIANTDKVQIVATLKGVGPQNQLIDQALEPLRQQNDVSSAGWSVIFEPIDA